MNHASSIGDESMIERQPKVTQMWPDGPFRMFSTERFLGGHPYSAGEIRGFVGKFICSRCRQEVLHVIGCFGHTDWLCLECLRQHAPAPSLPAAIEKNADCLRIVEREFSESA